MQSLFFIYIFSQILQPAVIFSESDIKTAVWNENNKFSDQEIVIVERSEEPHYRYGQIQESKIDTFKKRFALEIADNQEKYPGKDIYIVNLGTSKEGVLHRLLPQNLIGKIDTLKQLTDDLKKLKDRLTRISSDLSNIKKGIE